MDTQHLLDSNTFSDLLESIMREKNLSHIDGIVELCRIRQLDLEAVPELLNSKLKKRIHDEAVSLYMIRKKGNRVV